MIRKLLLIQGLFYLVTGIWPVIHLDSFMLVTGTKTDLWLVKMVGLLTISISIAILSQLSGKKQSLLLPMCTAGSFFIIDAFYALNGVISAVYLIDAALEFIFLISGTYVAMRKK